MPASGEVMGPAVRAPSAAVVLAVYTDAEQLRFISDLLCDDTVSIVSTSSQGDPFEAVRQVNPDVIVADGDAGRIDSIELCRKLKSDRATCDIPILLLTDGSNDDQWVQRAIGAGVDDFLEAGARPAVLRHRLESVSRIRKQAQAVEARYGSLVESLPALVYAAEPYPPYSPIYISPNFV